MASPRSRLLQLLWTICLICLFTPTASCNSLERDAAVYKYDVVIYGNTVAALAAAVQTKRMKKSVAIVIPGNTLGGLTTSGLGWTDNKNGNSIGGIAREFYSKIFAFYQNTSKWKYETRSAYISRKIRAQPGPAIEESKKVQWTFEPRVAEYIWEKWMKDGKIPIFRNEAIERSRSGLIKDGANITSFSTQSGSIFQAKMFIDASYEGDLMETAGVIYRTGREGQDEFNEPLAGVLINSPNRLSNIDPYVKKGNSNSGLIPGIERIISNAESVKGKPDPYRLQSYNYRLSLTKVENNKTPFLKPAGYNESTYEILFRYIESGYKGPFFTSQLMPNIKTDSNAAGQVSTDLIGGNYDDASRSNYAEYSYQQREAVQLAHKVYTQGFLWTLANHPRIPQSIRTAISKWGYAKDEFVSNGNWPYEIYIREARRMAGVYTMKQDDIQQPKQFLNDTVVGMGSYYLDVHQVERVVVDGRIYDEGLVHVVTNAPFAIPFNAIVPHARYATNFLNPVTMSSTHIAYAAIRMEPTYMILGQSAATAAVMAIEQGVKIQDVDREKLTARLIADKQVLSL
ncbi:FAD dependent oxidoreductase-domain-containing protein [Dactylonectria macrodidyma]|uniref:FAD dependent oxidoreductase-domain-containing protein n=1 Tax=Dactylonectria macrodidyma TaxID=307937 RepID=A0A9P9FQP5_9HYPO|nr:FAD dependent oxidoreductase-domain-containing protein [Dactylonectria macrodidyma]